MVFAKCKRVCSVNISTKVPILSLLDKRNEIFLSAVQTVLELALPNSPFTCQAPTKQYCCLGFLYCSDQPNCSVSQYTYRIPVQSFPAFRYSVYTAETYISNIRQLIYWIGMFTCFSYATVITFIEDSSLLVVRYSRLLRDSTSLIINYYSASQQRHKQTPDKSRKR